METSIVFCDNCNLEHDSLKTFPLPESWATALGLEPGIPMGRGFFLGSFQDASGNPGWQERDYGHICPACVLEEKILDSSGESGALTPDQALETVTGTKTSESGT